LLIDLQKAENGLVKTAQNKGVWPNQYVYAVYYLADYRHLTVAEPNQLTFD
jgi:hypothetical protein